ncbi:thioredoxin [Methyloligella solikamskensis]|uniref:Thioredoxin n=1 Tax=Methyloligella solikamskensis TaxID=1177756 RepID=A0ABW3J618_9HYPH
MSMDGPILTEGTPAPGAGGFIKNTTTAEFVKDVVEASRDVPVLVDFWAPWCGPCKQLAPLLEKAVRAAKGQVRLVKLNIDEHPEIPGQMGVQSIPAVFAFKNGQPVDGFMGAMPESKIEAFIARLIGADDQGADLEAAEQALAADEVNLAAQMFGQALQENPENVQAAAGLAKCYIKAGDVARAEQTLQMIPEEKANDPAVMSAKAELDLAQKSEDTGDIDALREAVEANPDDHQARFDLSLALNGKGDHMGAAEELLTLFRKDRDWNDGAARTQLLQFFEAWGPKDPATAKGRQKLSSMLFA